MIFRCTGIVLFLFLLSACVTEPSSDEGALTLTARNGTSTSLAVTPSPATHSTQAPSPSGLKETREGEVTATRGAMIVTPGSLTVVAVTPVFGEVGEEIVMEPTVSVPQGLQALVDQAVDDLAERLDISVEQIELVEVKAMVWPDGSLGCPQPGLAYIQIPQEGLLIRLRAGKRVYHYHSGGGSAPFFCEKPIKVDENLLPSPGLGNE